MAPVSLVLDRGTYCFPNSLAGDCTEFEEETQMDISGGRCIVAATWSSSRGGFDRRVRAWIDITIWTRGRRAERPDWGFFFRPYLQPVVHVIHLPGRNFYGSHRVSVYAEGRLAVMLPNHSGANKPRMSNPPPLRS